MPISNVTVEYYNYTISLVTMSEDDIKSSCNWIMIIEE
jgi:hypothetical protein